MDVRGYQLLLGLRRARNWSAIRPRAFAAAVDSLRQGWRVVVCDTDADLEGEQEGGSADVEERHLMARTIAASADVAFAVGLPGMKGIHGLVRTVSELLDHGVPAERIVTVVNRASKSGRGRAELAAAIASLLRGRADAAALSTPVFLPERPVDDDLRDGARFPPHFTAPLAGAFHAAVGRVGTGTRLVAEPELIVPGSLGGWAAADVEPR